METITAIGAGPSDWLVYGFAYRGLSFLLVAGVLFGVLWVWKRHDFLRYALSKRPLRRKQVLFELRWSLATLAIHTLAFGVVGLLAASGTTRIYGDVAAYGWGYYVASIGLMIVLHDAYFYWTHRLSHHPRLYGWMHRTHHRYPSPTPWGTFAMHPVDAVVQISVVFLFIYAFPVHPGALLIWAMIMTIVNVWGHVGYQFGKGDKALTGSSGDHDFHHSHPGKNFGFYFLIWDRLCGTYQAKE